MIDASFADSWTFHTAQGLEASKRRTKKKMVDYTRGDDPIYDGFREGWKRPCDAKEGSEELWETVGDTPLDRLQEICEAERDGRLVVLPCKVGDTVYVYNLDVCDWVMSPKVLSFVLCQSGWFVILDMGSTDKHPDGEEWCMKLSDFGKTVFLTREEAEEALKEDAENELL